MVNTVDMVIFCVIVDEYVTHQVYTLKQTSFNIRLVTKLLLTTHYFTETAWVSSHVLYAPAWMLVILAVRVFKASFHIKLLY